MTVVGPFSTGIGGLATRLVRGSMRQTRLSLKPVTQMPEELAATPIGSGPTEIVATTCRVLGSIRLTVPLPELVTHTLPEPTATFRGPRPTRIAGPRTSSAFTSMVHTSSAQFDATHTEPSPTARPTGRNPTVKRLATAFVFGSIRATLLLLYSATHTVCSSTAMPSGSPCSAIVATTVGRESDENCKLRRKGSPSAASAAGGCACGRRSA